MFYWPAQIGASVVVPPPRGLKRLYLRAFGVPDVRVHLTAAHLARAIAGIGARRMLDVGCGNGWLTCWMAAQFPDVEFVGCDRDANGIRFASTVARQMRLENLRFEVADVDRHDLRGSYDSITCLAVLQFVRDVPAMLAQFARLIRDNGHVILQVPIAAPASVLLRHRSLARRLPDFGETRGGFSERECTELLDASGLHVVDMTYAIKGPAILAKELFYLAESIDRRLAFAVTPALNWTTVFDPWYAGRGNGLMIVARKPTEA
jgi:2-polyprenyl-3-methyl-5-hydroxy-6-metoxy-1,4-benzoquinol methylase